MFNPKEETEDIDPALAKLLHEHGGMIGTLFVEEINSLVNKNKEFTLGNDSQVLEMHKLIFHKVGTAYLNDCNNLPTHPKLWAEFFNILSKCSELMYTEGIRIRREYNERRGKK